MQRICRGQNKGGGKLHETQRVNQKPNRQTINTRQNPICSIDESEQWFSELLRRETPNGVNIYKPWLCWKRKSFLQQLRQYINNNNKSLGYGHLLVPFDHVLVLFNLICLTYAIRYGDYIFQGPCARTFYLNMFDLCDHVWKLHISWEKNQCAFNALYVSIGFHNQKKLLCCWTYYRGAHQV